MRWQKIAILAILSIVIILIFLYGYAFLYDYFYSKNFPQLSITTYATKFDPTKFSDSTISFVVEMANALEKLVS